jgi:outer membrane receptor protein involved in Fe transport
MTGSNKARARVSVRTPEASPRGLVLWGFSVSVLALSLAIAPGLARAEAADPPAKPANTTTDTTTKVDEVVINGVKYRDTVLPTRQSSSSTFGIDLGVMDTPRNTTLLSTTQLETLNIEDPRAFSYLTASSYTDSAFGTPNIPRIRGQYADLFINGMRSSFTDNGYGVPPDFDSIENISITKGPASVIDGPGPGVGGVADLLTKRPPMDHFSYGGSVSVDSVHDNRWDVDVGGPLINQQLGLRINYSGEDSGSYFYDHYSRHNDIYVALRWRPTDQYQVDVNSEIVEAQYTEEVGVNRVNQSLIDNGQYLQGVPNGEINSAYYGFAAYPIPVGSPGNPFSPVAPYLSVQQLTNSVYLNPKITIDEAPSTSTRALTFNFQVIQSFRFNENLSLQNNTFYEYQDSDNQEQYYYADASRGSWTVENRTTLNGKFNTSFLGLDIKHQFVIGDSFRFAHTDYISNYSAETPGAYDLTSNPALWVTNGANQINYADAFIYTSSFGRLQYGTPGRDPVNAGNTGISNLYDGALFFEDQMVFNDQWSALFGVRLDAVQNHTYDPLGGPICANCYNDLAQSHSTGVFGLGQINFSTVYKPAPWVSSYITFDATQSNNPNGGEGGINTYGTYQAYNSTTNSYYTAGTPDSKLLRVDSYLYEAGLKFDLLHKKLFIGTAVFDQKRLIATGPGGTATAQANIRGVEIEANYQPNRKLFITASYSFIDTTLNTAAGFYNYPALSGNQYGPNNPTLAGISVPGNYIDGAGSFAVFAPGQKFNDPGVPQHVFNFLANYKFDSGFGLRYGVQVTGPIDTTTSGQLDLTDSLFVPQSIVDNGGYYKSPQIPWQYTMNVAAFYQWKRYTLTASIYNLTDQMNWQSAPTYYGNDFLVRSDPRTYELRLQAKF